jgi:Sporulation and spore germination/Immunoglobulin-like domain of bacterial spore germination
MSDFGTRGNGADRRPDDDVLGDRLRRALQNEAQGVHPAGDGLARIREGIDHARTRQWWRHPGVALAAAALLGVAVGGLAVTLGDDQGRDATTPASTASATPSPSTSESAPQSPDESPDESPAESPDASPSKTAPAETVTVPVYYLSDIEFTGPRLFREFHPVPDAGDGAAAAAVREMLAGEPDDPDYSSPWPAGTEVLSVTKSGDTATVDLSAGVRSASVGSQAAGVALQQLVYTVTAADNTVKKVELLVEGEPAGDLWGHVAVDAALIRAPMLDVLGQQWILSPTHDATTRSPVALTFYGTGFEGQIDWEVRRDGNVVERGFTTGEQGVFRETKDTVSLPPGTYEVRVSDTYGEDARPRVWDTKTFTVR